MSSKVAKVTLLCVSAAIVVAIFVSFDYQFFKAKQEIAQLQGGIRPALGTRQTECSEDVRVIGWLDRSLVKPGDSMTVWLGVENRSPADITNLRIERFKHPGLVQAGDCWQRGLPRCRPGDTSSAQSPGLPSKLKPGDAAMVLAELKLAGSAKPEATSARVSWQESGRECRSDVPFGLIDVVEPSWRFSAAIYSVLKDLALPVLLGLLAFSLQRSLQDSARAQAVRQSLTPRATENALRYLAPIDNAALSLSRAVVKDRDSTSAFFYLVFVLKTMRDLLTDGGGIVLSSLESEKFTVECWGTFFAHVKHRYGYMDASHVTDLMVDHESISQFCSALLDSPEATRAVRRAAALRFEEKYLKSFADGSLMSQLLPVLQIMAAVFQVEINWLHLGWYENEELKEEELKVPIAKWRHTIINVKLEAEDEPRRQRLLESLEKYEGLLLKRQGRWVRIKWRALRQRWERIKLCHRVRTYGIPERPAARTRPPWWPIGPPRGANAVPLPPF
jgi:hypothetical protein